MKKRSLVVGGGRFPGFQLCKYLLSKGHHVICLDNPGQLDADLANQLAHDHCVLLEQDIREPIKVDVDEIYNLTDGVSMTLYQANPLDAMRQRTEITNNLLKLAIAQNARVLHVSLCNIYSDFQSMDVVNKQDPAHPLLCMKEAQRRSESLCEDYRRLYNLDIRITRISNAYGPHLPIDKGLLLADIIVKALMNQSITLQCNSEASCSISYVDDLVSNIYHTMHLPGITRPATAIKSFDLSIHELTERIVDLTQSSSPIYGGIPSRHSARDTSSNIQRSWQQKVRLEQSLMKTIDYVEQQLHSNTLLENAIRFAHAKRYPFAAHQEHR